MCTPLCWMDILFLLYPMWLCYCCRHDPVAVERVDGAIMVNRMPVRKFFTRSINGLVELAGSGWKRLTGKG